MVVDNPPQGSGGPGKLDVDEGSPDGRDGANVLGTTGNQASADRPAIVTVEVVADPGATTDAEIDVRVDHNDDGAAEYESRAFAAGGLGVSRKEVTTFYLPAGGTYDVLNTMDPDNNNTAKAWEWIL